MFGRILNVTLPNNLLWLEEVLRRSLATPLIQENLGLPLPPNSLDLHQIQKQENEILDSHCVPHFFD